MTRAFRLGPDRSTYKGRFSDESFSVRDVQFNQPQVGIIFSSPGNPLSKLFGALFDHRPVRLPAIAAARLQGALQQRERLPALQYDEDNLTAIRVAFGQHHGKAPGGLSTANQRIRFQSGREARRHAGRIALSRVTLFRMKQDRRQCITRPRAANLFDRRGAAHDPTDRRQRLQMFRPGVRR